MSSESAPTQPQQPMILEFATNSVRNTTLATTTDDPYYEIVTRFWHPHVTKINKLDPASRALTTVCEIESQRRGARIRFAKNVDEAAKGVEAPGSAEETEHVKQVEPGTENSKANTSTKSAPGPGAQLGDWVPTESILKPALEKPGGIFVDWDGTTYRWKTHHRNFMLIRADNETQVPIVVYHRYRRHLGFWRMSKHATLEIKEPAAIKNMEGLIASYLLVERSRRHHSSV